MSELVKKGRKLKSSCRGEVEDRGEGGDGFGRGRDATSGRGLFYHSSARPKAETERFNGTQAWKWSMHWPSKASISASKRLSTCIAARQRGEWLSEEMRM